MLGLGIELSPAWAQQPRQPRPGEIASAPIRCWWKTDRNAIRVGEPFKLVLTCGVIETAGTTVVPSVNQLEPGAISLTPFEAVSGVRLDDVVVPPWRYLQYEYTMRLLTEGFFGQDVEIPALTVTYTIQGNADGGTAGAAEGRDQTYLLPPMPMRVLSLVPRATNDIRDASGQTFANVESRRFRSTLATVGAYTAFAFALVCGGVAAVRGAGRFRRRDRKTVRPVPTPAVLGGSLRTLGQVRSAAARDGWTPELRQQALAALRIAGAVALRRKVAQVQAPDGVRERTGQLPVRTGLLRRGQTLVSASTTASTLANHLDKPPARGADPRATVQQIADAMHVFAAATYGRGGSEADPSALTNALDQAVSAIRRLRLRAFWRLRAS